VSAPSTGSPASPVHAKLLVVSSFEHSFGALNAAGARYVVVGGLAVVFHGHARLTADIDLVVDLSPGEAVKTIAALERLGMVARPSRHATSWIPSGAAPGSKRRA
jgi:hypothetical protein